MMGAFIPLNSHGSPIRFNDIQREMLSTIWQSLGITPLSFTEAQKTALSLFFSEIKPDDWNRVTEGDPLWGRCISVLRCRYEQSSVDSSVKTRSLKLLDQVENENRIKQFFCNHLITTQQELGERAEKTIGKVRLNQKTRYVCLMPAHPSCIVDLTFKMSQQIPTFSTFEAVAGEAPPVSKITSFYELDILLEDALTIQCDPEIQKGTCQTNWPKSSIDFREFEADVTWKAEIILPNGAHESTSALQERITAAYQRTARSVIFWEMRRPQIIALTAACVTVTTVTIAFLIFLYKISK